jgi:hypothetical protein
MGRKIVCFGSLRLTRSRQDESIEVGEVGSKRPSLGGTWGHVTWWGPLIVRSSICRSPKTKELLFFF